MRTLIFHGWKAVVLVLAVLALNACASTIKGYSGPVLPADQMAVVRSGAYTDMVAIDGMRVSGLNIALLPGKHTMEMKPNDNQAAYGRGAYYFYSRVVGSIVFTAEAGHSYLAYVSVAPTPATTEDSDYGYSGTGSTDTGFAWVGYVTDETTGKRLARTDRLPLQAEPRGYPGGAHVIRR